MGYLCGLKYRIMKEKSIEIIAPEGYEVDKERSSFEKIVFRALPDKLPKTWEELKKIGGFFTDGNSNVNPIHGDGLLYTDDETVRNTWPTREEAEASIALAQLCQLRDRYNGGWKPEWGLETLKYVIYHSRDGIGVTSFFTLPHVLAFKTPELRDEFKKNFADLIEKAKPLLG